MVEIRLVAHGPFGQRVSGEILLLECAIMRARIATGEAELAVMPATIGRVADVIDRDACDRSKCSRNCMFAEPCVRELRLALDEVDDLTMRARR